MLGLVFLSAAAAAAIAAHPSPASAGVEVEILAAPIVVAHPPRAVLALAFAAPGRVLLLEDDRVSLWKLTSDALVLQAERPCPAPVERTRHAGGLIRAAAGSPDFWALRSGWPEALLFAYEDGASGTSWVAKGGADTLPWPSVPEGLRFRPGTNVLEGTVEGLPGTSFLALSADGALGVDTDDLVHHPDGGPAVRVGSAIARPWADVALATAPAVGSPDGLMSVPLPLSSAAPRTLVHIDGSIRALATTTDKDTSVVLAVVDGAADTHQILRLDLRRRSAP